MPKNSTRGGGDRTTTSAQAAPAAAAPGTTPTAGRVADQLRAAWEAAGSPRSGPLWRAVANSGLRDDDFDPAGEYHPVAQHLAFAWRDSAAAGRAHLEPYMARAGLVKVGEPGQSVKFVGRLHSGEGLFPGDRARVVTPGWVVHDRLGEHLLLKAKVRRP